MSQKLTPQNTPETQNLAHSLEPAFEQKTAVASDELKNILDELIGKKLLSVCKNFCYTNRYHYRCTIDKHWGTNETDASMCEWGNASYAWMFEELLLPNRLEKIEGDDIHVARKYFSKIVHSGIFLERYKNWRFQRRIRIPEYIKALDIDAHKIFWWLCDQDSIPNIAQRLGRDENEIHDIVHRIQIELHKRHRSHLLNLHRIVPMSNIQHNEDESVMPDIPYEDTPPDEKELQLKVKKGYEKLSWLEQFVVDSIVIDGLSAKSVVISLAEQNITTDKRVEPADLNVQHIYYFLRKTLTKLKTLSEIT